MHMIKAVILQLSWDVILLFFLKLKKKREKKRKTLLYCNFEMTESMAKMK